MDNLQSNIFLASQRLNDLTGYSGIEALKSRISSLETSVSAAQAAVRTARHTYKTTVALRASTQREVTGLLARKDSWTPVDLERFTSLYRMDHGNEAAVQEAATRLGEAEREAEGAAAMLSSSILSRYHEEQIWSDKIRRMSTWGTWGLMGVNILLFFVFQFGFEPWRRARLVHGFEEKVREALDREKGKMGGREGGEAGGAEVIVGASVEELQDEAGGETEGLDPAVEAVVAAMREEEPSLATPSFKDPEARITPAAPILDVRRPETWKPFAVDQWSTRTVAMRKQDVTVVALEGAAVGATVVSILATIIFRLT